MNISTSLQADINHSELYSDGTNSISNLQSFANRGSIYLAVSQILVKNQDYIVSKSLATCIRQTQKHQFTDQENHPEIYIKQYRLNYFLQAICDIYIRSTIYSLIVGSSESVESFQDILFLTDKYLTLGGNISNIFGLLHCMNSIAVSLIDQQDIASEINDYLEYVVHSLLSQFSDAINKTDFSDASQRFTVKPEDLLNRSHLNLLQQQYKSLMKLSQDWLAGDVEEQTETWNYLRDALNVDSPSYSPVII
jgi:hypothetical protein